MTLGPDKGENDLGSPIKEQSTQIIFLKQRLNMFLNVLDAMEPENTDVEDIDRLISMIDEIEIKCREFKNRD